MPTNNNNPEGSSKGAADYNDLTEEASKRTGGAKQARQAENDDIHEETTQGPVSTPQGDDWGENKVATSLDGE